MQSRASVMFLTVMMSAFASFGQTFEVATVRPSPKFTTPQEMMASGSFMGVRQQGNRVRIGSMTLRNLIATAYQLPLQSYVQGNTWVTSGDATANQSYDINATIPEGADQSQWREMLRHLLEERFTLKARRETREMDVYAMVQAKGGHTLEPAPDDAKGMSLTPEGRFRTAAPAGDLIGFFSSSLDHPAVDATGLTGRYFISFDSKTILQATQASRVGGAEAPVDIIAAVNDELARMGLKLERRRMPLAIVVVESAEKTPREN